MIECTTVGAPNELLFRAWLKAGIPIIRPPKQERVLSRQSAASSEGNFCDRIKKSDMAIEGVGKGKEKIDGIMITDSRAITTNSRDGRRLNEIDKNTRVANNNHIFEFSSQRCNAQVLNTSKEKDKSSMEDLGR
ncbi:hypothetical protein Q3G72_000807 [Acer saccharum]|nr:hypothetical protein Q3G72_000807 [Acer saccharum]